MTGADYDIRTHYCGCANETMRIPAILERCKPLGGTAIAITDAGKNGPRPGVRTQQRR